jgi:hypothetical protein
MTRAIAQRIVTITPEEFHPVRSIAAALPHL